MIVSEFSSIVFDRESYKYDEELEYRQVFGQEDRIVICVGIDRDAGESFGDILCTLKNEEGISIPVKKDTYGQSFIVYSLSNLPLDYGTYTVFIINTQTLKGYDAEFDIIGEECLANTMILTYSDTRNKFDTIFLTPDDVQIYYSFRFNGSILERATDYGIEGAVFNDQNMRSRTLSGIIKDAFTLVVGDNYGVPNGFGRKVRNALSCNKCFLNTFPASITEATSLAREDIGSSYPFFRFTAIINYDNNAMQSYSLKNYRYLCNNKKPNKTQMIFRAKKGAKVLTNNRRF